jgi:hypothetical protein
MLQDLRLSQLIHNNQPGIDETGLCTEPAFQLSFPATIVGLSAVIRSRRIDLPFSSSARPDHLGPSEV